MDFVRFMSSTTGRILRIAAGIALIFIGAVVVQGAGGVILALIGLVPLVAGIGNFLVFAPLFGGPFFAKNLQPKAVPVRVVHSEPSRRRYH